MIEYAFCDKTGTLTSNEMRLRLLVLDGEVYGDPSFQLETCGLPPDQALRAFDPRLASALLDSNGQAACGGDDGDAGGASAASELTPASVQLSSLQRAALEAFTALTVCHALLVEQPLAASALPDAATSSSAAPPTDGGRTDTGAAAEASGSSVHGAYQGPSPDEVALVDGARRLGVIFASRSASGVVVDFIGVPLSFEVLAVLEFSSERQRMSVVVRRPDGSITLFCKGADQALLPLLTPPRSEAEADIRLRTEEHLHRLSALVRQCRAAVLHLPRGAERTVRVSCAARARRGCALLSWRPASWTSRCGPPGTRGACATGRCCCTRRGRARRCTHAYPAASCPRGRHQASVMSLDAKRETRVAAEVESELQLVGATGVEDKLQEGVPDTIRTLLAASIRVWVITGDKQETAISVGVACGLLQDPGALLLLNAGTLRDTEQLLAQLQVRGAVRLSCL
jgi:magnesium-transporting ATPase (P-type)